MMSLFIIAGAAIFVLGLVGVLAQQGFVHKLISLNIFTSGIFLIFISTSVHDGKADPLATALVLTGLVVTLGSTAFALMLIRAHYKKQTQEEQIQEEVQDDQ
ncbi:MAG TPA: NADH-quinone oxidoreductase subunit K [Sulfurovum sp.]|uniref:NADH-quinone oxidoreductase subunit K n=1 Tax=Sulfurovum sp. TaxID=1969726 RepID=UPI002F938D25